MTTSQRFSAFVAYLLPVVGWLYVGLFQRKSRLAVFHTRQAICLVLFLIASFLGWAIVAYVLALIPYAVVLSAALFTLVIVVVIVAVVIWIIGMVNALRGRIAYLPLIGRWALRLPR